MVALEKMSEDHQSQEDTLPANGWIFEPNFVPIHPIVVKAFYKIIKMSTSCWRYRKSQGITKVSIHQEAATH